MKTNPAPAARGFTLLEVLVALVVLATGLLALAKFQGTLMQDNALSKQRTEATMYAQQKIEMLRSYSLMTTYNTMATGSDTVTGTSATFARSWSITPHTSTSAPQYTTVAVSMVWTDNGGTRQTYTLSTNIAANNPVNTGQLIATTTSTVPSTTTTSTSSTTSTSTSSSTSTSTTTTTSTTTSTTTTTTSTTTTTQCQTTISGTTQKNWDTVSSSPSGTCSAGQKTYSCIVIAGRGTTITLTENNGAQQQASANCGSVTVNM
jgi:type IV pilus modification protein PilV